MQAQHAVSTLPVAEASPVASGSVPVAMATATAIPEVDADFIAYMSQAGSWKQKKPVWMGPIMIEMEGTMTGPLTATDTVRAKLFGCCPVARVVSTQQFNPDFTSSTSMGSDGSSAVSTLTSYDAERKVATYTFSGQSPNGPQHGTSVIDIRASTFTLDMTAPQKLFIEFVKVDKA